VATRGRESLTGGAEMTSSGIDYVGSYTTFLSSPNSQHVLEMMSVFYKRSDGNNYGVKEELSI